MLVLFETPAGYAIFKLLNEKKLKQSENLFKEFESPDAAARMVELQKFVRFSGTTEALESATALIEGKMSKKLKLLMKKLYQKELLKEPLAVSDPKIGAIIKEKFTAVSCVNNSRVMELMRCLRSQMASLIPSITEREMSAMSLGLAHSLSRYKLKFSPEKVDTMIVQAISLLDDLDKESNNYIMRCKEMYGWHFPELSKIVTDNLAYVKTVKKLGYREQATSIDLSDVLPDELIAEVKAASIRSLGTEITDEDVATVASVCDQILEINEYRAQLYEYIRNRMLAVAPNLTVLVGELVGARLIAHAGTLLSLAKHPSSTVQILGAEKALFRALKTHSATPKYGLLYHAQLVGSASAKMKGKMSRMLAAKAALAVRMDALGEGEACADLGVDHRAKLENRLKYLEEGRGGLVSGTGRMRAQATKYVPGRASAGYDTGRDVQMPKTPKTPKTPKPEDASSSAAPAVVGTKRKLAVAEEDDDEPQVTSPKTKRSKHETPKKPLIEEIDGGGGDSGAEDDSAEPVKTKKTKKKKPVVVEEEVAEEVESRKTPKKVKKPKSGGVDAVVEEVDASEVAAAGASSGRRRKKSKSQTIEEDD